MDKYKVTLFKDQMEYETQIMDASDEKELVFNVVIAFVDDIEARQDILISGVETIEQLNLEYFVDEEFEVLVEKLDSNDIMTIILEKVNKLQKVKDFFKILEKENIVGSWVVNSDDKIILYWWTYGEDYELEELCDNNDEEYPDEMIFVNEPDEHYMFQEGTVFQHEDFNKAFKYWISIL